MWRILIPILIAAMGVTGNIVLNTTWGTAHVDNPALTNVLKLLTSVAAVFPPLYSFVRAETRARDSEAKFKLAEIQRRQRETIDQLRDLLRAAILKLFVGENLQTIRANIMVVADKRLRILCSINMEFSNDHSIEFDYGQGCAGTAWERAEEATMRERWVPLVAPRANLTPKRLKGIWRLSDAQIRQTAGVLWVVSTPIFRHNSSVTQVLGVLNFDGVGAPLRRSARIQNAQFHKDCADIAEHFSALLVDNQLA